MCIETFQAQEALIPGVCIGSLEAQELCLLSSRPSNTRRRMLTLCCRSELEVQDSFSHYTVAAGVHVARFVPRAYAARQPLSVSLFDHMREDGKRLVFMCVAQLFVPEPVFGPAYVFERPQCVGSLLC